MLTRTNMSNYFKTSIFNTKLAVDNLKEVLLNKDIKKLQNQCKNSPKLRTFIQITDFKTDNCYLSKPLSFIQRKALAKLRLGVLSLRIETGRFERPK